MLKVFHGLRNIGGMAGLLAAEQKKLGVDAFSYCFKNKFNNNADRYLNNTSKTGLMMEVVKFFISEGRRFDIYQFYYSSSFTGNYLQDIPLLKKLGKKVFFYFCGCDIRDGKATIQKYQYSACKNCWPMLCLENRKRALDIANRYADKVFVSTPDLLEFVDNAILLPQPVDFQKLELLRSNVPITAINSNSPIKIAHAPSNRAFKGSDVIINVISTLQKQGQPIELMLIENVSNQELLEKSLQADIVIDQILIGSYGQYSVEMMALAKPVVCYLRDDLVRHYPSDLPIVNACPETLSTVLIDLINNKKQWSAIGQQGVEYVRKYHNSKVVAEKMLAAYTQGCLV